RDDARDRIGERVTITREFRGAGGHAAVRHYNVAWPRHVVGPVWVEFSVSGDALVGANFAVYQSVQVDVAPRLLAVGEYKDVVEFSGATATYKAKKVILDTSVLQDVFVYPL